MLLTFTVRDEHDRPIPGRGRLRVVNANGHDLVIESADAPPGRLTFFFDDSSRPRLLSFIPEPPGFWTIAVTPPRPGSRVLCERLPSSDGLGGSGWWWHSALNVPLPSAESGKGIKIGVIDTAFDPGIGLEHVRVVTHTGQPSVCPSESKPAHGEIVCRIIGQRAAGGQPCYGIAAGAELISIAASTARGELDLTNTVRAFIYLAREWGADLVNLSAGLFDNPLRGLRSAIGEAARLGTLCIAAAGNAEVDRVAFPARYPECIAVGAVGLVGWGPESSNVRRYGELRIEEGARGKIANGLPIFHFPVSAWGEGLDVIAPGVGILINRCGPSLFAATGTSYAAPMACGLLAAVLGRDAEYLALQRSAERYERARTVLKNLCVRTGLAQQFEGWGLPRAPVIL